MGPTGGPSGVRGGGVRVSVYIFGMRLFLVARLKKSLSVCLYTTQFPGRLWKEACVTPPPPTQGHSRSYVPTCKSGCLCCAGAVRRVPRAAYGPERVAGDARPAGARHPQPHRGLRQRLLLPHVVGSAVAATTCGQVCCSCYHMWSGLL